MRIIFELITPSFTLFSNPIYNCIVMGIIGSIAFAIAYYIVGELGLRGKLGSIAHWIIRIVVFILLWLICLITICIIKYVMNNWLIVVISLILLLLLIAIKKYANVNRKSILNKKVV